MTFRNTSLFILIFIIQTGCKGLKYLNSGSNPANISVILQGPTNFYTNQRSNDSLAFYLVNNNSQNFIVSHWWSDLYLIGQSRFYPRELSIRPEPNELKLKASIIAPADTLLLIKIPLESILTYEKTWTYKAKKIMGPHLVSSKKYYPYIYLSAQFTTKVPNQEQFIQVRSEKIKINISEWKDQNLKNKKTVLSLSSDVKAYHTAEKRGTLICTISNISQYPIQLFSDPGSVRFKLYGYNPNRTSIMHTEYVLDNGKLPLSAITINTMGQHTIEIPLEKILFTTPPNNSIYYWTWNKKTPPISPLVYGKKDIALSVDFWFGVVIDGQEFLSNTLTISIQTELKKKTKGIKN